MNPSPYVPYGYTGVLTTLFKLRLPATAYTTDTHTKVSLLIFDFCYRQRDSKYLPLNPRRYTVYR